MSSGRRSNVVLGSEPRASIETLAEILREGLQLLVVCLSHSWGGLEQVAANDSLEAASLGIRVKLLCLEGSPIHEYLSRRHEVELAPLKFRPRNNFDFKLRGEINRAIAGGVNLIHTHQTSLLGSISPWLLNKPQVSLFASRHIMNSHDKRDFYHRMVYGRVDSLLVMSQSLRKNIMATHPLRDRQVKVVNLGLDFDKFDPDKVDSHKQREAWGADEDTTVIGLVGRIDPAKGQGTFIKAAAGLNKSLRESDKVKFVIVGEETLGSASTHLEELKGMVSQFGLGDTVVFAGYQENIPEVMRGFDVFVMPSRRETFGLVAIEAMAMECPIVISSGGSAEEIIGEEEFGLQMRPEDAFDLQRQLRYLLDNPMERVQMGQRARDHVKRNYDRKLRLNRTLELYERALRRRGAF